MIYDKGFPQPKKVAMAEDKVHPVPCVLCVDSFLFLNK